MLTEQPALIWALVGGFTLVLGYLFVRSRGRDLLVYVMGFYLYFAFGPIINRLLGLDIYRGIFDDQIGAAVMILSLAMGGMLAVGLLVPARLPPLNYDFAHGRTYPMLKFLLAALSAYVVVVLVFLGPRVVGLDKHDVISVVGPQLHYPYLTLQFYAAASYLLVERDRVAKRLYWLNVGLFVVYCLASHERDFIFALGAVTVVRLAAGRSRIGARHFVLAGVALWIATVVFAQRMNDATVDVATVLNQGSILYIDSSVAWLVPDYLPFMGGWTYLNSLFALLPGFVYENQLYLLDWFVEQFAPDSPSGYGFSLSAEAYLNFGYVGVPLVFMAIAFAHRWVTNRIHSHPVLACLAVLYTGWVLYAFRGDSLQLFKGLAYGTIIFVALYLASRVAHATIGRSMHARLEAAARRGASPLHDPSSSARLI